MILGYGRVSTDRQNLDLQMDALRAAGCERIFMETASGSRADRPELRKMLEMARTGDIVAIYRLDRLGRSLRHLIEISEDLQRREIGLRSLSENIDTTTASGRAMFAIMSALAAMEREVLVERTRAGLAAAAARGRRGGRRPSLDKDKLHAARAMLSSGTMTAGEVARQLGVSPSTLYRHLPGGRSALEVAA